MTEADIADATLAAASKTDSNVNTFASDPATSTEQADLLQHVDTLKETFAKSVKALSGQGGRNRDSPLWLV